VLLSKFIIFCCPALLIICLAYLTFRSPALYDPDSYYNIAVSGFLKDSGVHHQFRWAQFSTFKDRFADKDFLLHAIDVPLLYLSNNIVTSGKYAVLLNTMLFILAYFFIIRKYLPEPAAAVFLVLPFFSSIFSQYILELRSVTPANIFTILGVYFLINKRSLPLLIISVLYPLAHISFFLMILFAIICEAVRYIFRGEFAFNNIRIVLAGSIVGCLIHPNFPDIIMPMYLNGILAPLYSITGLGLGFSGETMALDIRTAILNNFAIFLGAAFVLWAMLRFKNGVRFSSAVWLVVFFIYFVFALSGARYWYQANALFFIFLAAYVNDLINNTEWARILPKIKRAFAICAFISLPFLFLNIRQLNSFLEFFSARSAHYEDAAKWMKKNIPGKQTIYHSNWEDSAYFICLNPKDNYISTNDPIYMFYLYPKESALLDHLSMGRVADPHEALVKIFKATYGYVRKEEPLFRQVLFDKLHFKILYEDRACAIFELLNDPK
jgi:hypothetical protein